MLPERAIKQYAVKTEPCVSVFPVHWHEALVVYGENFMKRKRKAKEIRGLREKIIKRADPIANVFSDSGVYTLIYKNKIMYMGYTRISFASRIVKHLEEGKIPFDSYEFIIIPNDAKQNEVNSFLSDLIFDLKPLYNASPSPGSVYLSRGQIKKKFKHVKGLTWCVIKRGIKEKRIGARRLNCNYYFDTRDIVRYLKSERLIK